MKVNLNWIKHKRAVVYDQSKLHYKHLHTGLVLLVFVVFSGALFWIGYGIGSANGSNSEVSMACIENPEQVPIIIKSENTFTEKKLWDLLVGMNVRFPHIVIGQAQHETGYYTSPICKFNHNYFGMKVSTSGRATTVKGEMRGHGFYNSWQESALDYAFLQTSYLRDLKTEEDYYYYIDNYYAEPGRGYGEKIRIKAEKVRAMYDPDGKITGKSAASHAAEKKDNDGDSIR